MNAKTIVRFLLLSVVCLAVALVGYQLFTASAVNGNDSVSVRPQLKDGINVYYFHGNQRCTTCVRMEGFTKDTLNQYFSQQVNDGQVQLNIINVDLNENQHFIDDYQLIFRTVVIANAKEGVETDWRRLDKIWELANDEAAYQGYLAEEIGSMMKHSHG